MKLLRKNKHPLTEKETIALNRLISDCKLDKTGEKSKWITYRLLNEAVRIGDLNDFYLLQGLSNLEIEYKRVVDKRPSLAVK